MRIGVDLGGTKIEAIALAPGGRELGRIRIPTPRDDYPGTLEAIAGLVERLEREIGESGSVGIGIPGALSRSTGRVRNANSVWLLDQTFGADLEHRLSRPVRMMNDANCFALSEAVDGAGAGASVVFGAILGTGVGGGIVLDGRILEGAQQIAGEWGHNPLPWPTDDERPGPLCYCGRRGCIETFLSGPGLARDHSAATGRPWTSVEVAEAAARPEAEGSAEARAAIERYVDRLARGLATVVNVLDPDILVLGGGLSDIEGLPESVTQRLPDYVFSERSSTPVVRHRHGDSSGVRGAAWLWPETGPAA